MGKGCRVCRCNGAIRNSFEIKITSFAHVPVKYIKISPPKKMSEEQKEAASERFKQMWKDKQGRED